MTTKNIAQAKKVTGMENIPFITPGASVEDISGYVVTEDGLTALVEASITAEQVTSLTAAREAAISERDAATAAQKTAEDALVAANEKITAQEAKITELQGQLDEALENGGEFEQTSRGKDEPKRKKTPAHLDATSPINSFVDKVLGKPGAKKIKIEEEEE